MSKYKVIKTMPTFKVGSTFEPFDREMTSFLLQKGFIEPIKEDTRWRAMGGGRFYYIDVVQGLVVSEAFDFYRTGWGYKNHEFGNYFKSESTAQKVADSLKLYFEWLHSENASEFKLGRTDESGIFTASLDKARKAVLRDDKGE